MNRTIELNLERLIPRHSGALPRELKELTSSLLAQSRTKCNLGADDEVARTYLCAHLACERLKTTLNLPPIEARPPIPPRAYAKLYKHFDTQLQSSAARAKAQRSATSTPSRPLPQRGIPSKEQSFKSFSASSPTKSTPAATYRTPKRGLKFISKTEKENKVPRWVIPAVRFVCREMGTPKASPHITAGVETLLTLPNPKPEIEAVVSEEKGNVKVAALIASVWFFVVVEMRGRGAKGLETRDRQALIRDLLNKVKEESFVVERVGELEDGWKGWEEIGAEDVLVWNKEIVGRGWKEMDWFMNVPEGTGVDGDVPEDEYSPDEEQGKLAQSEGEDDDDFVAKRVGRKPDTMHREKYDYLSAKNRAEYKGWKEEILALLSEKQKRRGTEDTVMADA